MKILPVILITLLISCNYTSNEIKTAGNGRTWNIQLEDSLGNIQIELPKQLDTLFRWIEHSDCGDPCNHSDYRIQSKSLPIFKDDGFYYFPLKDSVEQFTIKHPKIVRRKEMNDSMFISSEPFIAKRIREKLKSIFYNEPDKKYIFDTIIFVSKKQFAIVAYSEFDSAKKINQQMLIAGTGIKGNMIELYFEHRKSYKDTLATDFIHNAFESIKTIRITEPN